MAKVAPYEVATRPQGATVDEVATRPQGATVDAVQVLHGYLL